MKDPGKSIDIQLIPEAYLSVMTYGAYLYIFKSNILYCNGRNSQT